MKDDANVATGVNSRLVKRLIESVRGLKIGDRKREKERDR